MDKLSTEQRHKNMQAVKSKDTGIEIALRKALWAKGIRYRKNYSKVLGKPDIVITKHKIAVFADSEFWHGYDWDNRKNNIKTNKEFWIKKIERNKVRDVEVTAGLESEGWIVLRFWGKQIEKDLNYCLAQIEVAIKKQGN